MSPASPFYPKQVRGGRQRRHIEEVFELTEPPRKLGLYQHACLIDHTVKDTCLLRGSLGADNTLIVVNGVDVRDNLAEEASHLIGQRSNQEQGLTFVRRSREHGPVSIRAEFVSAAFMPVAIPTNNNR